MSATDLAHDDDDDDDDDDVHLYVLLLSLWHFVALCKRLKSALMFGSYSPLILSQLIVLTLNKCK